MKRSLGVYTVLILILFINVCKAADTASISVAAVVLSKSNCKFNSANATLNFGVLDPSNPVDKTISTTIGFICHGSANPATFYITDNGGLYRTGPSEPRMRHSTQLSEYLPYNLSYTPSSGSVPKNTNQNLTISGTVGGTDYQNAYAGNYSDTLILSINP
jgi:spore coat protein U-like protein